MSQRHPIQNQHIMLVTTNVLKRKPIFSDGAYARIAIETLYRIQHFYPFFLFGFVVMPDHCHFLVNMPEDGSISKMMGIYKRATAFNIGQGPIWQPRFHLVLPKRAGETLQYIHMNPARAGLCELSEQYPWSSACGKWDVMGLPGDFF